MRTQWQGRFTWAVLALASGCGGQVVVDPGTGSSDDISGGVCEAYCVLVQTATDACRVYDWCMEDCVGAFTRANEYGCAEEMSGIYDCYTATFKKSGFCQGGCPEEINAYHSCRDLGEGNQE